MLKGATGALDLVIRAHTIHTMTDEHSSPPTVIAIAEGLICGLGGDAEFADWSLRAKRVIDRPDATITPGLTDNHIHPVLGTELAQGPDLTPCLTEEEVVQVLRARIETLEDGQWLLGWGLDPNIASSGELSNAFLDDLVGDRPAWLRFKDAHSGLASTSALKAAGIGPDFEHLLPSNPGWLVELPAMAPVLAAIPPLSVRDKAEKLHEILNMMARAGFTEGFVMDMGDPDTLEVLAEAEAIRPLDLKLRISPWVLPEGGYPSVDDVIELQGRRGERWMIDGVKLIIDGTIDNGTAWLYRPDSQGESTRSLWLNPQEYRDAVTRLHAEGIGTSTHAIGDKGVDYVSETLAALPPGGPCHRIEHIETVTDEIIQRMFSAGIFASMQPTHCTHFVLADGSDNWSLRLGEDRLHEGFRWADIRDAGVTMVFGSDWPVAICDSREIFASAQLRRRGDQPESLPVLDPSQAITARDVLEGFTTNADLSVSRAKRSLAVGQPATLVMFGDDPLTTAPDVFAKTDVLLTLIDGTTAHDTLH